MEMILVKEIHDVIESLEDMLQLIISLLVQSRNN